MACASTLAGGATSPGAPNAPGASGGWSKPFAVISVLWIIAITPLFLYPFPLNPAALATVVGFLVLLAIYYVVWARTRFKGPQRMGTDAELTEIEREFERAAGELGATTA